MAKTKILIAIDEPQLAKKIVYTACSFLDKKNSEITLINVIETNVQDKEYFLESPQKYIEHEAEKSDFAYIESYLSNEKFDYKGFLYKDGDVAKNILEVAEKEKFDLIVIGSHNKSAFERLLLGSVSYKVAMQSKCSVMIIKNQYSKEISPEVKYAALLAVDGSSYSKYVANNIWHFLDTNRANINIINVIIPIQEIIPPDAYIYTDIEKIIEDAKMTSNEILRNTAVDVLKQKFNVTRKYNIEGDPADTIIKEAESNKYDLIIVGSHGKDGVSRWLMGSVSNKIYTHSNKPVLIVKSKDHP